MRKYEFYAINSRTKEAAVVVVECGFGTDPLANAVASLPNADWRIVGDRQTIDAATSGTEKKRRVLGQYRPKHHPARLPVAKSKKRNSYVDEREEKAPPDWTCFEDGFSGQF